MEKRMSKEKFLKSVFFSSSFFLIIFIFIVPLLFLLIYSLKDSGNGNAYSFLFRNNNFIITFFHSIYISGISGIACIFLGFPIALWINGFKNSSSKKIIIVLMIIPLLLNSLVKMLVLRSILEPLNLIGTDFAVILGMIFMYLPFMIISIYYALSQIDRNIIDSSYDLGANKFQTFWKIILPLSYRGAINGFLLVFLPSLTTVIVPQYLGNNKNINIGNFVISLFVSSNFNYIAATSIVTIIFAGLLIAFAKFLSNIKNTKLKKRSIFEN